MEVPQSFHIPYSFVRSSSPASPVRSIPVTVGVDEAGRGALAGPVVAGACVLPPRKTYPVRISDSKQMTPEERDVSFQWLTANCVYGVGSTDAATIDRLGILAATEMAMQQAVAMVAKTHPDLYILVDGRDAFWFDWPHSSIIHGDAIEPCIGAASIIAKVTRDRWMVDCATSHALYGFDRHKGYGAPAHIAAVKKNGVTALHRRSFLKAILASP